jgi:hypothetical protein
VNNSCFFESEELGSNHCGQEDTGTVIPVSMWWMMPCSGLRVAALGHNSVGNSLSSFCTWGGRIVTAVSELFNTRSRTCLGKGKVGSCLQNLLLSVNDRKATFCKEIHAK